MKAFWTRPANLAWVFFLVFFCLYLWSGLWLFQAAQWRNDEFFEIDAARVAEWMIRPDALHLRTRVHPIYVLLVQPLGSGAHGLLGSPLLAVQTLTAAFAAAAVAVAYLAALRWKRDAWLAGGIAAAFGVSASQWLLGAVPDTTGLATLALAASVALYLYDADRGQPSYLAWLGVGVLALGVTTTNVVAPLLLYGAACFGHANGGELWPRLRTAALRSAAGLGCVLLATALLSGIQRAVYGNTKLFFLPDLVSHEVTHFSSLAVLAEPLPIIGEVLKHFLVAGIVAPLPHQVWIHAQPAVTFVGSFATSTSGGAALLMWIGLAAVSVWRLREAPPRDRLLYAAAGAALLVQLSMHCFYGVAERGKMEFFLYTGNATWLVFVLVLSGLRPHSRAGRAAIGTLVFLTACTTAGMLDAVAFILGRGA